jgi:hypothetical protein
MDPRIELFSQARKRRHPLPFEDTRDFALQRTQPLSDCRRSVINMRQSPLEIVHYIEELYDDSANAGTLHAQAVALDPAPKVIEIGERAQKRLVLAAQLLVEPRYLILVGSISACGVISIRSFHVSSSIACRVRRYAGARAAPVANSFRFA